DGIPAATGALAAVPLKGAAQNVIVENNNGSTFAYVATGDSGLAVVDVTTALKPIVRAELDLPGFSSDVAVDPVLHIAAVAAGDQGVHFIDISDPVSPLFIRSAAVVGGTDTVEITDGVAFVSSIGGAIKSFDLTTGEQLQSLQLGGNIVSLTRQG